MATPKKPTATTDESLNDYKADVSVAKLLPPRTLEKTATLSLGQGLYSDLKVNYTHALDNDDLTELLSDVSILKLVLEDIHTKPIKISTYEQPKIKQVHSDKPVPPVDIPAVNKPKTKAPTEIPSNIIPPTACKKCKGHNFVYVTNIGSNGYPWYAFDCLDCFTLRNGTEQPTRNFVNPIKEVKVPPKAKNDIDETDIPF